MILNQFYCSKLLRGFLMDPAGKADRFLNYVLTNQLFKSQELWISRRKRREFLEECLRNNAKRLEQLRNELPNQ